MGALRHRGFRLLFAGQLVSLFGDGLYVVALSFAVLAIGSVTSLGLVLAAGSLPLVAFVLIGGVWADRLPRRRLMLAADLARTAIQATLAALVLSGHATLTELAGLNALYGAAAAFFQPAATGLLPQLLPTDDLASGNGLLGMVRATTQVAGGAVGGALVSFVGPGWAIGIDAATFAVSAATLLAIPSLPAAAVTGRESFLRELAGGWNAVREQRWIWTTIVNVSLFLLLYVAPFEVIGPVQAKAHLGGGLAWGLIGASFAGGMALGGLLLVTVRLRRPMRIVLPLFVVCSVCPLLLAVPAPLGVLCAAYVAEGFSVGVFVAVWETELQRRVEPRLLSRVSAWDWMGSMAGLPLGSALAGPIAAAAGIRTTLVGMAVCGFLLSLMMAGVPDIRGLGAVEVDHEREPALAS